MSFRAVIYDSFESTWHEFINPVKVVTVFNGSDVINALFEIESHINAGGYAVGFLSYEAASAFDEALEVGAESHFPLCSFGLFEKPHDIEKLGESDYNFAFHKISEIERKEFDEAFSSIKQHIRCGSTYQVNYTHKQRFTFQGDPFSFFQSMIAQQPTPYAAFIEVENWVICSASPELFFLLNGDEIFCKPMKGTISRGADKGEDEKQRDQLHNSDKDKAENVMIVDMIRNDLSRIAETGTVVVDSLFDVTPYPTLWQMTSTIRAQTQKGLAELLAALFPCASITGAPKVSTMHIIHQLESETRKIYTGAVGLLKPERQMQFNVSIRTALIDKTEWCMEYGIGSGIVWDSDVETEFNESHLKAKILDKLVPKFWLIESFLFEQDRGYFLFEYHLKRLIASAHYFGWMVDYAKIQEALEKYPVSLAKAKVRLLVSERGEISLEQSAVGSPPPEPVRLRPAIEPVDKNNIFLQHKTSRRTCYEKAIRGVGHCDDVVLWNEDEYITETTIYNIVAKIDGQLVTPPVSDGLLPGTMRQFLLDRGKIKQRSIHWRDIEKCEELYVINSIRGMRKAELIIGA